MIPLGFHPDSEAELAEAAAFYESRLIGLGKSFAGEVARTVALIRKYPESGKPVTARGRQVLVTRFPYTVVYRHDASGIVVIAVAHQRRRPGYWRGRK